MILKDNYPVHRTHPMKYHPHAKNLSIYFEWYSIELILYRPLILMNRFSDCSIIPISIGQNAAAKHLICGNVVDHLFNLFIVLLLQSPGNKLKTEISISRYFLLPTFIRKWYTRYSGCKRYQDIVDMILITLGWYWSVYHLHHRKWENGLKSLRNEDFCSNFTFVFNYRRQGGAVGRWSALWEKLPQQTQTADNAAV